MSDAGALIPASQQLQTYKKSTDTYLRFVVLFLCCFLMSSTYYCCDIPAALEEDLEIVFQLTEIQYNTRKIWVSVLVVQLLQYIYIGIPWNPRR